MPAVHVAKLTKRYGSFTALDGIDLTVNEGEFYALIGANGAGKTTLFKLLVGLLLPTSGTAEIFGHNVVTQPVAAKKNIGYVSDDPDAYEYLTGREFLTLTGKLRGMTDAAMDKRIGELMPMFPIGDIMTQPMSQYSRGNKQKIAFLASLLTEPKLLIIDEPIVGMDAPSIDTMGAVLNEYVKKGNTVLIVTHILDFAKKYAHRAGIMKNGKIVKEIPVSASVDLESLL